MLNLCNINSHSVKVQALIKKSGLPELEVLKAIAQYGEDIQLDQLPRVNSEMFLKTALGCLETSKVVFASISDILDYTKTETIEDANIALNNEFRDLEIRLTALGSAAILDLKHRPTIFVKPKTNIPRTYIELATKVYSKFPLLSYIGTAEEYAEYIQSIFKNSITRGTIYWHGTGTDFSDGFNSAIRGIGSGAPETKTRNDFYFAKQGETVLQYIPKLNVPEGLSRNDRKELCWNNLWWELKEILGNGKSLTDETWRNKVITELPTKIPNKHGIFNRDSGGSNGTYLTERKNHYKLNTPSGEVTLGFMSDAEFLDLFGFELGKDSFNSWTLRNYLKFAELFDSEYLNILGVYPAIVNVHKGKAVTEFNLATNYAERGVFDKVKETHAEAVISDSANNEFGSDVLIMTNIGKTAEELKNNNKIHWLGSKLDIEGFKNWKNRKLYSSGSELEQIRKLAIANGRIILKADGTFDYALAPNNKKSNLTEKQWLLVRTKSFKKWFGDWEKILSKNIDSASTVYNELNIDTTIARRTINNSDSKFEGGLNLDNLPDFVSEIDSHGIAKGNEIQRLLDLLNNGIDKSKVLYTAPLTATEKTKAAAALLGTAGGTSYRGGLFIIAADFGKTLNQDGIGVVFINDMSFEDKNSLGYKTAKELKNYLQEHYPNIDFRLYSEAKQYYEGNESINKQYRTDSVSKVVDENGEPLVVYHGGVRSIDAFKLPNNKAVISFDSTRNLEWAKREGYVISEEGLTRYNNGEEVEVAKPVGIYFAADEVVSRSYFGRRNIEDDELYTTFLNIRNPYTTDKDGEQMPDDAATVKDLQRAKDNNQDGVIIKNVRDYGPNDEERMNLETNEFATHPTTDYIVFNSNQVKSATDNVGTFSEENDDISDSTISKLGLSELTKGLSNNFTKVLLRDVTDKLRNLYGIQINLVTTEELKSELFKGVIANPHLTKGFILDGLIYVNADTASLDTPIHELLHMFLGGIKYSNPTLYFKLVSSVELLPLYSHYLEMGTMTRGDLNEELFVEEFAKYIVRRPSLFDSIDAKDLNTLLYDINRVLDSFFMGEASFQKSDVRNTFTKSILALADQYGSDILNIKDSIDSARLHRLVANEKSDLLNNGELEEICE